RKAKPGGPPAQKAGVHLDPLRTVVVAPDLDTQISAVAAKGQSSIKIERMDLAYGQEIRQYSNISEAPRVK
ncbi:MAG: hypothetical protein V3V97_10105, partial [Hyphomicrobiaceae bacterium]